MNIPLRTTLYRTGLHVIALFVVLCSSQRSTAQNTSLIIKPGTTLTVAGNMLVLNNTDVLSTGTLSAAGANIYFTGSANTSITTSNTPVINIFTLQKAAKATVTLNNDITVINKVDFKEGLIELHGNTLSLGRTGVLSNEGENARITGVKGGMVTASGPGDGASVQRNTGKLGAVITSTQNTGVVTVNRMHEPIQKGDHTGIQRTYLIQPANNAALDATLRFYYLDAELNDKDENTLSLWSSIDGITWVNSGVTARNTTDNYVEKTGLATLSYFTLSDADNTLPVRLEYFRASCKNKYALVEWKTATEINTDKFVVQKSIDGVNWGAIQTVTATNNANGNNYSITDNNPQAEAFYRLQIVEKSGSSSYSAIFSGGCADVAMPFIVYPNPATSVAVARVSVRQASNATIKIIGINGQALHSASWALQPGNNQYNLPVQMLPAATYLVQVLLNDAVLQTKLIKQ